MALKLLEANITLDLYDHDGTRPQIKSIALDDNTRYVFAKLTYKKELYDIGSDATVKLIIIRPDKVGAQIAGEAKEIRIGQADESIVSIYGAYAELDQPAIAVAGTLLGQFIITSGDQVLRSQIFTDNNGQALDSDTWAGQYDGYNLDELVEKVDAAVDKVDGMEADVSELKSGLSQKQSTGKYSFVELEPGYFDRRTGIKKERESDAPYVRSVDKIPVTDNILVEYLDLPNSSVRSDYGVIFVYWDSRLNYIGMSSQITTDAVLTSIPSNAAYIAIQIISKTSTPVTVENAPTVNINWFERIEIQDETPFSNWLDHTSYSESANRIAYSAKSAFSAESYMVNPDLRYIIRYHSNANITNIYVWEYTKDDTYIGGPRIYNSATGYVSFKPTENTAYIRLSVNFSGVYSDPGIVTLVCSDKENLLPSFGGYVDETQTDPNDVSKKISIKWDGLESVKVTGTMSKTWNVYSQRIYYSASEFPDGIKAGDKLYMSFDNNDLLEQNRGKLVVKSLCLTVMFFFNNSPSDRTTSQFVYDSVELDVPKDATGMQIMLRVQRGQSAITLNPDGTYDITYVYDIDAKLDNFVVSAKNVTVNILDKINRKNMPCFVSFIDDDAASDLFCARYFNACMHNGITGAYAVQTDLLNDTTTVSKMLEYEEQGMGVLTHCSIQTSIYRADSEERLKACMVDLAKAKRKMRDCGFLTYNHFVIPYGTKSDDLRDIARYLGFESAISTSDNTMNRYADDDRYYIKRYGYVPQSDYSANANSDYNKVLKLIGDMVKIGAGWVIITTHFCDDWSGAEYRWTTYPYDTTLDSNGYEVGYTEFNDLVTAIKATGAKIVPYTVGINYFHSGARG